jgi:dihydrofolate reductase
MAKLIYSAIASLDGYIEDPQGGFEWGEPDEDVFRFLNELERPIGTYLYGRRMYETLSFWESAPIDENVPEYIRDWTQIWREAEKVVFSRTLEAVPAARTRIERSFDAQVISDLKATVSRDLTIGGADLACQAIEAGLVDELHLYTVPVIVGGGKPWLPRGMRLDLDLLDSRSFTNGFVFLRYRPLQEATVMPEGRNNAYLGDE